MAYAPTTWVADVTKVGPTNLNHLELGVQAAAAVADAALPTPAGVNGQFLKKVGGVWVPSTFALADLPANIPASQLAGYPTDATKVLHGDGTWAAAGVKTTASAASGGPPASPSDGDIWIATAVGTNQRWAFQYNASGDATYKWEFIGGPPLGAQYTTAIPGTSTWALLGSIAVPRPGVYLVTGYLEATNSAGGATTVEIGTGTSAVQTVTLAQWGISSPSFLFSMSGQYTPGLTYTAGQSVGLWAWANGAPSAPNSFLSFIPVRVA